MPPIGVQACRDIMLGNDATKIAKLEAGAKKALCDEVVRFAHMIKAFKAADAAKRPAMGKGEMWRVRVCVLTRSCVRTQASTTSTLKARRASR